MVASILVQSPAHADQHPCDTRSEWLNLGASLPRLRAQIDRKLPLLLVALGSSSTTGEGASSLSQTYPAQLEFQLKRRFPSADVRVVNHGVRGEGAPQTRQRLQRDAIALAPQLVLWQVGANDAINARAFPEFDEALHSGITMLQHAAIDVILVPPQYAPRVIAAPDLPRYMATVEQAARSFGVGYFPRFDILREAAARSPDSLRRYVGSDGLHHTDLGYRCLAQQLADAIQHGAGTR